MKTIQFINLVNLNFDIHDVIVINHSWRRGDRFETPAGGRPDNGIMLLTDCDFEYMRGSEVCERAERGQIVYSPIGSEYTCRFAIPESHKVGAVSDYLINFRLFDERGEEFRLADDRMLIRPDSFTRARDGFERIASLRGKGFAPLPRIKGLLYELLCDLSLELQKRDVMTRRYAAIYPAVKYIYSTDLAQLDPSELADICHISRSCLRRLFREYFGMPPLEYVNRLKLAKAEESLRSGVMSVAEVAESLGFSDASYFSRFYKKMTGRSPSSVFRSGL